MPGSALTPATVGPLLAASRYDPAILPQLEAYVEAQCASGSYDSEANMAALKLYQFHPEELKAPMVAKILVKALMNLPSTDFLSCTYLVPERVLDEAPISTLCAAANLLERCSFRQFWETLQPLRAEECLAKTPGFDVAIRKFVLATFALTYQSVPTAHCKASLGLPDDAALAALVKEQGWEMSGDLVKISLNANNQPRPKQVDAAEAMSTPQMTRVLAAVASASLA